MRGFFVRLSALVAVGIMLAANNVAEKVQSTYMYEQGRQDMLRTVAASAYINILLASVYVTYIVGKSIYQSIRPHVDRPGEAKRMVCLASDDDIAALQFRDMCRIQTLRASMAMQADKTPMITYVTPVWLWYYIYTVGFGLFIMGYTLSGGNDVASSTMGLSITACAVVISIYDASSGRSMRELGARLVCAILLLPAAILTVVRPYRATDGALESVALGVVLPVMAPVCLCSSGHRAVSRNLRPDAAVAFSLPFVMALSLCYLSAYAPMRAAWIDSQVHDVDMWWNGNITTETLVSRVHTTQWLDITAVWLLAPIVEGCVYVIIMGCLTHPHKLPGCAAVIVLVLAARQAIAQPNADAYAGVSMAAFATVAGACLTPPKAAAQTLESNVHVLFEDTEEERFVDSASADEST